MQQSWTVLQCDGGIQLGVWCNQVQLKRFEYNWEFDRREKLNDSVPFDEVIDLGQFMNEADATLEPAAADGEPEPEAAAAAEAEVPFRCRSAVLPPSL